MMADSAEELLERERPEGENSNSWWKARLAGSTVADGGTAFVEG